MHCGPETKFCFVSSDVRFKHCSCASLPKHKNHDLVVLATKYLRCAAIFGTGKISDWQQSDMEPRRHERPMPAGLGFLSCHRHEFLKTPKRETPGCPCHMHCTILLFSSYYLILTIKNIILIMIDIIMMIITIIII